MQEDEKLKKLIAKKIGEAIRFYRNKKNLSQEKLAFNIGVDRTYISALEQGVKCASVYCLFLIAKELQTDIKNFIDINITSL